MHPIDVNSMKPDILKSDLQDLLSSASDHPYGWSLADDNRSWRFWQSKNSATNFTPKAL